jgi:hypothetical protein
MNTPVRLDGHVLNGEHPDMWVRVDEDPQSTTGYLINRWWPGSTGHGRNSALEDRVESQKDVDAYFKKQGWIVEWKSPAEG